MRISAITGANYSNFKAQKVSNTPNFKGILIEKCRTSNSFDYRGEPSGSSYDGGHYSGSEDTIVYAYHPFRGESKSNTEKVLKDNNYSSSEEGYNHTTTVITERGKTLPFSKSQYEKFDEEQKEFIKKSLL